MKYSNRGIKKNWLHFLPVAMLLVSGCGYTTRSMVSQYKTIYITPFLNKIDITGEFNTGDSYKVYKPLLETSVTKAVVSKFLFDGNLKPVNAENADVVLKGEVVEFRRDPVRYTDNDDVEEYRLNLLVNIRLLRPGSEDIIWEEKNFTGDATYFTSGPSAKSEEAAITDAINDLARRIVERAVEEW